MRLYNLVPTDSRYNEWLFWYQDEEAYVRPRQFYADLVCSACGKLDEVAAINRGIDPSVTIKSKRDFIGMTDGLISVSKRAKEVFIGEGIKGLRFIPLPDKQHWVPWPEVRVKTDLSKAGFEYEGPRCGKCGRYRGAYVGPFAVSLTVPEDPMVVFASEIWNEDRLGRVLWLFAQEPVAKALKLKRLTGMEVIKATGSSPDDQTIHPA
jgi:hypothetical protein